MEIKDIISTIVDIHNKLVAVNTHGEDTLRMAEAIYGLRTLMGKLSAAGETAAQTNE